MNETQRNFRREMKELKKERGKYFEHQEIYNKRSSSIKRNVAVGVSAAGIGYLIFRFVILGLYASNGIIDLSNYLSTFKQNNVVTEINQLLEVEKKVSSNSSPDDLKEYSYEIIDLDIKYATTLEEQIYNNIITYRRLIEVKNVKGNDYALYKDQLNNKDDKIINAIKTDCNNYGINVTFTEIDDIIHIKYEY